jgi:putative membrane protein
MRSAVTLLSAHALAVLFSVAGLLIALPNPQLWEHSVIATRIFSFGMQYAGSLHIFVGAAAMLAFGAATIGRRRTLVFFAAAVLISLACELLGTRTGWPFGAYEYTEHLGPKLFGLVPMSIPLSWFALGLASYLLAFRIVAALGRPLRAWAVVALGAWFLTVWDLVLDPAMAHESLPVKFWI